MRGTKNLRFQRRVYGLFLLTVMLPMILLSVFQYNNTVSSAERLLTQQLIAENERWLTGYRTRSNQMSVTAKSISTNPTIIEYFNTGNENDAEIIKNVLYRFRPMATWIIGTEPYIYRLRFFTANEYIPEDRYVLHTSRYSEAGWMSDLQSVTQLGRFDRAHTFEPLLYDVNVEPISVVSYKARLSTLPESFMQLDISSKWLYEDITFVIDGGTCSLIYSGMSESLAAGAGVDMRDARNGLMTIEIENTSYYCAACEMDGMLFLSAVPIAEIEPQIHQAQRNFIVTCASLAVLMIAFVYLFSHEVTHRIRKIGAMVAKIVKGEYIVAYRSSRNDEIDRLGNDIRKMGEAMDELVNRDLRQSLLRSEAEYRALQYQINPHFIFNTLESFQMIAEIGGLRELSDAMCLFGKLVRYNIGRTVTTTVRSELENVSDYVTIRNLNLNNRVRLFIDADEALMSVTLIRLILQPIVENAIEHGMPRDGELEIRISAERVGEAFRIRVSNTGRKPDCEEMKRLTELLESTRSSQINTGDKRIALQNIQRRLLLKYGEDCVIRVINNQEDDFTVYFTIPIGGETDDDAHHDR